VNRAILLLYPVFCGMDTLEEIFLPGVSKEDLVTITTLPVSDSRFESNRLTLAFINRVLSDSETRSFAPNSE
jgi:hypothetical protein